MLQISQITLLVLCLPLISYGSIEDSTDINKSKKIQIVYIKVPLVTNKLRNQNNPSDLPGGGDGGDKSSSYSSPSSSSGPSGKPSYMGNGGGGYHGGNSNYMSNYDYPSSGLNTGVGGSGGGGGGSSYGDHPFNTFSLTSSVGSGGSNSGGYGNMGYNSGSESSGTAKKPLFSSSSSSPSFDHSPLNHHHHHHTHPNSIISSNSDSSGKHKSTFPFPINVNNQANGPSGVGSVGGNGYSQPIRSERGNSYNGAIRPTGFQGFDKNYNQDQRFNQGPINSINSNPINNNHHMNTNNNNNVNTVNKNNNQLNGNSNQGNPNYAFNYDKIQGGFNSGSSGLPGLGLMGSSNGFLSNLKPSDGIGNGLIKPMGSTGKLIKPTVNDDGLGSAYGAASSDSLPYGTNEADPIGPSYNPSDFFGPSATSGLDTGLDDFTGFGDMTFDSDALLNFGGMQPYSGDLGMEKNNYKKNKGYGSLMSSALSGLGSFGFLSGSGSGSSSYNPMKGMAMAMSNTFPSFAGPKLQGNHLHHNPSSSGSMVGIGGGPSNPSTSSSSSSGSFGGIRTRLTNLLSGRLPSLNFASLTGLGSPGGMSGLGGINSGLLGLFGL